MNKEISNIVDTLKETQCPFAGNGKDEWLRELLFKPNQERYDLMQWILEQLELDISESSETENSVESKIENLTEALCAIGVCSDDDSDVIEGSALMKKQLTFWNFLCSMLSQKHELHGLACDSTDFNESDYKRNLSNKYERSMEYVNKVCESINLVHSFDRELKLFPSDLLKEANEEIKDSGIGLTYEDLKKKYDQFGAPKVDPDINSFLDLQQRSLDLNETENVIPKEESINEMEDSIAESLKNLENLASKLESVHNNLKPFLDVKPEEFVDIGPAFEAADEKLNVLSKLRNCATMLKSLDSEIDNLKSEVTDLHVTAGSSSGDKLNELLGSLSQAEEKE